MVITRRRIGILLGTALALGGLVWFNAPGQQVDRRLTRAVSLPMRDSDELSTLMREEVVEQERCRLGRLLDRAVARGELSPDARITPLFHDIAGALIFTRAVVTCEPVDRPFLEELVDHVLLPVLNPLPKEN